MRHIKHLLRTEALRLKMIVHFVSCCGTCVEVAGATEYVVPEVCRMARGQLSVPWGRLTYFGLFHVTGVQACLPPHSLLLGHTSAFLLILLLCAQGKTNFSLELKKKKKRIGTSNVSS